MPSISYRVYTNADLADKVESYAEEHNIAHSEAWQELARRGLQGLEGVES